MAEESKDTIYIDVDDEITGVIDKVMSSEKKLVALVLPKRASVFQSIVNMKLLKRKGDEAKKNIVLVTAESSILPLAGAVGLHVAKTLASKPEIPPAPVMEHDLVEAAEEEALPIAAVAGEPEAAKELKEDALDEINKSAEKAKPKSASDAKNLDTIELDNTADGEEPTDTAMPAVAASEAKKKAKKNKNKKLKVPNFNKFRLLVLLGSGGLILLIILFILMFSVFPHATVDIKTNAQNVNANLTFKLNTLDSNFSASGSSVPAKLATETKTYTATANATGQQNNGQKASGSVDMSAEECNTFASPNDVPAGTGITQGGLTYITQTDVSFNPINSSKKGNCLIYSANNNTSVSAQNGGSNYNTSASANFSVPGRSDVTVTGSASGGTDDTVTIVSQADINSAENKISTNSSGAQSDLSNQLTSANYFPIAATFNAGSPNVSPNATAGTAAGNVTVTETVQYNMYGAVKSDLNQLLNNNVKSQTSSDQNILNNGLSTASYSVGSSPTSINMVATAEVGPNINVNTLKKEITGQKVAAIESIVKSNPNVSSVTVKLSPFYVSKAPSTSKITINIAKPSNNPSNAQSN